MRGRRPKPLELRLIGGNAGRRPLPKSVPHTSGPPKTPAGLSTAEISEWNLVVGQMEAVGTISPDNAAVVEVYVRNICRMREAEQHLAEEGTVFPAANGILMASPWLKVSRESSAIVLKCAAELGLTPSARSRVHICAPEKESVADKYLTRSS